MELTQTISALIFALILIAVIVYVVMSRFVTGPMAGLKRGERVILAIGVVGILLVVVYAAVELLFQVVF